MQCGQHRMIFSNTVSAYTFTSVLFLQTGQGINLASCSVLFIEKPPEIEYRKQDTHILCRSQTYGVYSLASSASVATNAKIGSASNGTAGPICLVGTSPLPYYHERHCVAAAHSFRTLMKEINGFSLDYIPYS